MDKVAYYEEMILDDILEKEASYGEEEFLQDVYDAAVEKIAATKFKEMLAGGTLSNKTNNILKFNQKDGRFDRPLFAMGAGGKTTPGYDTPTRSITKAKLGIGDIGGRASKATQSLDGRRDAMVNKGLNMGFGKYHGEKNMIGTSGYNTGALRYN